MHDSTQFEAAGHEIFAGKVRKTACGLALTVFAAAMVLRLLGLDDICGFRAEHLEEYFSHCGEDGRGTAVHTLWNMRCLFRWLVATGAVSDDPLAGIGQQKNHADTDYVPADQIAKPADLATLDLESFRDVRDRLIAYTLCYDYALRIGEVARFTVNPCHSWTKECRFRRGCGKVLLAHPERFELPTLWSEARCSVQLSYGCVANTLAGATAQCGRAWVALPMAS